MALQRQGDYLAVTLTLLTVSLPCVVVSHAGIAGPTINSTPQAYLLARVGSHNVSGSIAHL
jgi:hypothetical protein